NAREPRRRLLDLEAALVRRALDVVLDLFLLPLHLGERLLAPRLELLALERARDLLARAREEIVEIAAQVAPAAGGQAQPARTAGLGQVGRVGGGTRRRPPGRDALQEVHDRAPPAGAGGARQEQVVAGRGDVEAEVDRVERAVLADRAVQRRYVGGRLERQR